MRRNDSREARCSGTIVKRLKAKAVLHQLGKGAGGGGLVARLEDAVVIAALLELKPDFLVARRLARPTCGLA